MQAGFTQDIEPHLAFHYGKDSNTAAFLSLFPSLPSNSYFPLFCSTCKLGFRVLIKRGAEFWKVSNSSPHPDEYLEAHCYHGYPARLKSSVASTTTKVDKVKRCPLRQVTTGLTQKRLVYSFIPF